MRLNDLKNFLETSECKTISEAARKLGVTQPALTESIKRLESDAGKLLFYRSRSGISLTPEGEQALEHARAIFSSISQIEDSSVRMNFPLLTIGCHPTVAAYSLPQAFEDLFAKNSKYRIKIEHALSRHIQSDIQDGHIDVGIVINPVANPDLVIKKIAKDHVSVWKSKHKDVQDRIICNLDLFQTQSILRKWKNRPADTLNTSSLDLITRLTESGIGYGIIPSRAVDLVTQNLVKVNSAPDYVDEICLVHRPEFGKTEYEKVLLESLKMSMS